MLDQTTQNVSASAYRGKLGFGERDETALSKASVLVVQTLEEFGHEVEQFHTKRAHRVRLECDHYIVDIRHRRSPHPMRQSDGAPCRSHLDLIFTPRFPEHVDAELTEMILARAMQALLADLEATTVEWLDTGVMLEREAFLSAFAPDPVAEMDIACDIQLPVDDQSATPVGEVQYIAQPVAAFDNYSARDTSEDVVQTPETCPRGAARFAPVDETFGSLTLACDRVIERRAPAKQSDLSAACRKVSGVLSFKNCNPNTASAWVLTAIMAIFSLPIGITAAAVNLIRGGDMRFSVQMMAVLAALMFLESSVLLNAAVN
ncbi:hypothetical protein [Tritonibacter mobilis]|uniref:hypothetical protein n=1 Tax=Tritonibacter mobilis TaxID=379347 RepID=UPI0024BACB47|nr:hypothetical protein [Tritonibacter mobilis]WHQ81218.1 hypothetical protein OMR53_08340 [Tritonibacter mobilis]